MILRKATISLLLFTLIGLASSAQTMQMPSQGQQKDIDVPKKEMKRFVEASDELQVMQQDAQKKMMEAIEANGMDVKRYSEIERASRSGQEVEMTDKEEKAYDNTSSAVQKEQMKLQQEAVEILNEHDFERQRFMEISQALRSDKELLEQYKEIKNQ
ncbi:MAG TPA: DUF4168 domain-containing protein [Bacteroidales bacterium]|nr:DUF4168 domain-containing protein [Bacteroidales bacterium]